LTEADQLGFLDDGGFHQSQVLKNRGIFQAYEGLYDAARRDLTDARDLAESLGLEFEVAFCEHNLGLAASFVGDLPLAFAMFQLAEQKIRRLSGSDFESKAGHVRALMVAGLFREAASMAHTAANECDSADFLVDGAEIRLLEATSYLEQSRLTDATVCAEAASQAFRASGSEGMAGAAELTQFAATFRSGESVDSAALGMCVELLVRAGRSRDATEAKLLLADVHTADGRLEEAAEILSEVEGDLAEGPTDLRLVAAASKVELQQRTGAIEDAIETATSGLVLLAEQQSLLGGSDLRAGARRHADRLAAAGLSLIVSRDDPELILDWQERVGLTTGTPPSVRPPVSDEMRMALGRYRALGDGNQAERHDLEEQIRSLDRSLRGANLPPLQPLSTERMVQELGPDSALSFSEVDSRLVVTHLSVEGPSTYEADGIETVHRQVRSVRAGLRSRASGTQGRSTGRLESGFERLGDLLLGGQSSEEPAAMVIVPTSQLFALPWSMLPSLIGRPVSLATSISAWTATTPSSLEGSAIFVAGPDLDNADNEVGLLAETTGGSSTVLTGSQATVENVLAAIDGASVAHIVAHGTVRTDNPLFSSLRMADGELSVYELSDLDQAPSLVVLSACHVGLPADSPGQELLGMVTGFLNAGTSCVLASTLPVPDNQSTIDLMTRFHRFLGEGMSPAVAWAEVQRTCPDDEQLLDTAAFTVFGRG
ncbi:MAG: CHAT domain-containing protein, partial [Actinomycetota bacterium]